MRSHEEALIEHAVLSESSTAFTSDTGDCHAVGDAFDQITSACDVSACLSNAAAGVLDERTDD